MGLRRSKRCSWSEAQLDVLTRTQLLTAIRRFAAFCLTLVACSGDQSQTSSAPSASSSRGPDQIILRIPRTGGAPRAAILSRPDSIIWTESATATVDHILGFDPDAGSVAYVDTKGNAARIDLRSGEIHNASKAKLSGFSLAPASNIFAVDAKGAVVRLSPSGGDWKFSPPIAAHAVFSQTDGSIVVAGGNSMSTTLWLLRPPEDSVYKSAQLSGALVSLAAQAGDRLYFAAGTKLVGVSARKLEATAPIDLPEKAALLQPTPSGDRIFVSFRKRSEIAIVDRYAEKIVAKIDLPGVPRALRMDPLGRYLLARPPKGDSVWVIAVGTNRLLESLQSKWLADLPGFVPSGEIAVAQDSNVVMIEPETGRKTRTFSGGISDFWYYFSWNGFRPRAEGLDAPVTFAADSLSDSLAAGHQTDSIAPRVSPDSSPPPTQAQSPAQAPAPAPAPARMSAVPRATAAPPVVPSKSYTVSFAALMRESSAQQLATSIEYLGRHPQVVKTSNGAITVFRVILGPYGSREEAERVGHQIGKPFWIYEGYP